MESINEKNELKHFGVMGMKWGIHRANKKGTDYTYRSHGTKSYAKRAEKARKAGDMEKASKFDRYHKRSVELDKKMQTNSQRNSTSRAVVKTLLTNSTLGGRTYEAVKASTGGSRYISRGTAMAASYMTGPFGATVARSLYVRQDNPNSSFNDIKYVKDTLKRDISNRGNELRRRSTDYYKK